MPRCNPYLSLPMGFVDREFLAEAEVDIRISVREWLSEEDPQWRSLLREHLRDDLQWLRAWRAAYLTNTQKEAA